MKKIGKNNSSKAANEPRKKNVKKVAIASGIGVFLIIYFVYSIIQLIMQPTDVVAIANGNLSEEESAVRLCDSRRNSHTRRTLQKWNGSN